MAADPKAQSNRVQETASQAKAAAKAAAVAEAKAEARAESEAATIASGPVFGTTAGPVGIAANVPLDVFTQRSTERTAARQAKATTPDLSESAQRMADSLGRGRVDTANLRDIGATETPAFVSEERPGANRKGPSESEDNPLGDRHAALRESPDGEADAPMDFGESPTDVASALGERGDGLRSTAGLGGGLQGVADSLHAMPESGQGRPGGKGMISDGWLDTAKRIPVAGAVVAGAELLVNGVDYAFESVADAAADYSEMNDPDEQVAEAEFEVAQMKHRVDQADWILANPESLDPPPDPIPTAFPSRFTKLPLEPIVRGDVKDPGPSDDRVPDLPPGWIDGDAILPPGLRTGAAVGGAKGSDGIDWAHHRAGASTPSPEASGGRGAPSDTEAWRRQQTNESMVGQPGKDGEASGGGGGTSQEERRAQATTPAPAEVAADGIGLGGEPGDIITDQGHNDASGIDRPGGSDIESKYPTLTISHSRHADDNADDNDD